MRIRTCYRCLIAGSCREKREIRAKLKLITQEFTVVSFRCDLKPTLLPPGSVVNVRLKYTIAPGEEEGDRARPGIVTAIVRGILPNGKLLLAVHPRSERWFFYQWHGVEDSSPASLLGKCWPDQVDNIASLPFIEMVPVTACCGWPTFSEFNQLVATDPEEFRQPWCATCERDRAIAAQVSHELTQGEATPDVPF